MTTKKKADMIREQLEQVQARIIENEKLQKKYPDRKRGLLIALNTLKHLENDMFNALQEELTFNNFEVYEVHLNGPNLKGHSIPIVDFGEFLIKQQGVTTSFASDKALGQNAQIPPEIVMNSQLDLVAIAQGSVRVMVSTSQKVLCEVNDAETPVKHAFNDLKKIIECGDNEELLKAEEIRLGSKKILAYRNLLKILYEKDLDMEISSRLDKQEVPILNIKTKEAKNTFNTLIKNEKPHKNEIVITGILRGVDFDSSSFKIVVTEGKRSKNYIGKFSSNLEDQVARNANKLVKANLSRITKQKGIGERPSNAHELLNFIEN